jgi:CRP-like cAMP-binding protein
MDGHPLVHFAATCTSNATDSATDPPVASRSTLLRFAGGRIPGDPDAPASLRYSPAMDSDDLRRLEACGAEVTIPAGHVLIERGHHGSGLYVILEGTVVVEAPEGNIEFGPGSVIGERALLSEAGTRAARVRATTDLRAVAIDRLEVERLCADDAEFARRLADATA